MAVTIVVGAQWGDEGKGKIVDMLSEEADVVVRYNGGNNAGHSIMNEYGDFVLHLIPAGIFNPDALCLIERGVVIHPPSLVDEMSSLEKSGISLKGLKISPYAHMVMPWHITEDMGNEGNGVIGTTLRGIGPCYKDKAGRWHALRIGDMRNKRNFLRMLDEMYIVKKAELNARFSNNTNVPDIEAVRTSYMDARECILPYVGATMAFLHRAIRAQKNILLEGAQGTLLDVDYGTYPYVTSSNTTSIAACLMTAISPRDVGRIIGVAKAYMTRVGEGPFPTEIKDSETHDALQAAGREFGATTGRPRRCGWLDLPLLNYAAKINHFTEIALTKIDIIGLLDWIRLCISYKNGGRKNLFQDMFDLATKKPDYISWMGWGNIENIRLRSELPKQACSYIEMIEQYVHVPIRHISIGGKRKETITL